MYSKKSSTQLVCSEEFHQLLLLDALIHNYTHTKNCTMHICFLRNLIEIVYYACRCNCNHFNNRWERGEGVGVGWKPDKCPANNNDGFKIIFEFVRVSRDSVENNRRDPNRQEYYYYWPFLDAGTNVQNTMPIFHLLVGVCEFCDF